MRKCTPFAVQKSELEQRGASQDVALCQHLQLAQIVAIGHDDGGSGGMACSEELTGLLAPLANMIPAVGEEAGWRGYMMPRLKERLGLLNGRLLGGVIWGVWHWPLMLLVGYEYGTNYLGAPLLGLVVWCVVCFALNTLLDWLYEKTGCIWVPAIAHGALNAVASMPVVLTDPAKASYYTVLGPMPIGLIGMLPVLAVAVWLTLRQMKQEEKN